MTNTKILFRTLLFAFLTIFSLYSKALDDIYISKGTVQLMPIAINDFATRSVYDKKVLENVINVVEADLVHCGFFKLIPTTAFIENNVGINHKPHFASWRQINANLLLNGEIIRHGASDFTIKVILWDVISEKNIFAQSFSAPVSAWRKVAHQMSDKMYEAITGDKGYFDTRIFYISETTKGLKTTKRLAFMDYDGANHQFLSNGKFLVLTPRLSPNAKQLLYVSYEKKAPKVFIEDLKTGRSTLLGNFTAMSFAPRFSPDGSKIIFSLAKNGVTDIYEIDLRTKKTRQLTSGIAINTSPSYSQDGQKIYFNSDRSGNGQIYSMDSDGSNLMRISFGEGSYSAPVCSPNGKHIVFTKNIRGQGFFIGTMRTDGSEERLITTGYLVEGATWGPNSRIIAFARTSTPSRGRPPVTKLYTIDISGHNEKPIPTPNEASDAEWSWHH
jgi:TolB protein